MRVVLRLRELENLWRRGVQHWLDGLLAKAHQEVHEHLEDYLDLLWGGLFEIFHLEGYPKFADEVYQFVILLLDRQNDPAP